MSYYLFLDDERNPYDVKWKPMLGVDWCIVRNYEQFVTMIEARGVPRYISFDHDLADFHYDAMLRETNGEKNVDYGPEKTGYDCAKWLVEYCIDNSYKIPEFQVHSLNPIGAKNIETYLENSTKYVYILNKS